MRTVRLLISGEGFFEVAVFGLAEPDCPGTLGRLDYSEGSLAQRAGFRDGLVPENEVAIRVV